MKSNIVATYIAVAIFLVLLTLVLAQIKDEIVTLRARVEELENRWKRRGEDNDQ